MRFIHLPLAASVSIALVSCSNGNLTSASQNSIMPGVSAPSHVARTVWTTLHVAGVVVATRGGDFTIKQVPGACGSGYFDVYTSAATKKSGAPIAPGYQVTVAGSGSCTKWIDASTVISSSAPSISISGTVLSPFSRGFTINSGVCGYVPVYTTPSTSGLIPPVGRGASVSGHGSCTTYVTASSISYGSGSSPMRHVLTADYLGTPWGTSSISWKTAAGYLSWAETGSADANAIAAAGMKTILYTDPSRTSANTPMYSSNSSTFAQTCSGSRIYDTWDGVTEWVMNPASSSMRTLFANYVASQRAKAHYDLVFEDTAGALTGYEIYDPFHPGYPCGYSDASWISSEIGLAQTSSVPVMVNALAQLNGHQPSLNLGLLAGSNTVGGNMEDCYNSMRQPKQSTWGWAAEENTELEVAAKGKLFECLGNYTGTASSELDARMYSYASFLLTYAPSSSIYRTRFTTPSGFHVMPETQFVPLAPVKPAPTDVSGLEVSSYVYVRQYGACYLQGSLVGPCAVVVNSDGYSGHPFPYSQYRHTLVIAGSGVADGGGVSVSGPAPPSTLPPLEARIVFP